MKFHKIFAAGAMLAAMVLAGCSDDHIDGPDNPQTEGKTFATIKLQYESRSETQPGWDENNSNSNNGYEVGLANENKVNSVLVLLTSKDATTDKYTYVSLSNFSYDQITTTSTGNPIYTLAFDVNELVSHAGESLYMFAFCNPSETLETALKALKESTTNDLEGLLSEATQICSTDLTQTDNAKKHTNFLMSNWATFQSHKIPSETELYNTYNNKNSRFDLGTVKVSRAAVRFDFKEQAASGNLAQNEYAVKVPGTDNIAGSVILDGMALITTAKQFYTLPRVSNDGLPKSDDNKWALCGQEIYNPNTKIGNYVVSPNHGYKTATPLNLTNLETIYNDFYWTADGLDFKANGLHYDAIGTNFGDDNEDDSTWDGPTDKSGYKIWKYTTENTIPGVIDNQRHAITTAVIFRGHIAGATGSALATNIAAKNVIYAYEGTIYGNREQVWAKATENTESAVAKAYQRTFGNTGWTEADKPTEDATASNGGLTIYRPADNGTYPVYYVYYNRHNDNDEPTNMGIMEFATVRNNVYKLAVTTISQFGHPGDPGDDPDPEKPNDPDEDKKAYFQVSVQVLPWVVRVNNIEF